MTTISQVDKDAIDNSSYETLLRRWRFPVDDLIFQGESGIYYLNRMRAKKAELTQEERIKVSKKIGWEVD